MGNAVLLDGIKNKLIDADIRPTFQRIKILEYLEKHKTHPTVDEIYSALAPHIPTLSKTTVYNTLSTFSESGIVNELKIDGVEARFDIITKPHGHFKCVECGMVHDFDYDVSAVNAKDLDHYKILTKNFYMQGVCPKCLEKAKSKKDVH